MNIDGPGAEHVSVSGDDQSSVFDVAGGVTATISGLTVTDGSFASRAAWCRRHHELRHADVSDCVVTGNSVVSTPASTAPAGFSMTAR